MQPFPGRGRFFLLRHGATQWNLERRVMGRLAIPLSEVGERQIRGLAPHLQGLGIEAVWTSPLARARGTADLVAQALVGVPVIEEEGLTEVDYAAWEGATFAELLRNGALSELQDDPVGTPIPGGGESLLAVRDRVYAAMARIAERSAGAPALVVSHGDPLRLVVAGCLGLDLTEFRRLRLDNGALSAIELTGSWAEVKFVNMRPDLAAMLDDGKDAARAGREAEHATPSRASGGR